MREILLVKLFLSVILFFIFSITHLNAQSFGEFTETFETSGDYKVNSNNLFLLDTYKLKPGAKVILDSIVEFLHHNSDLIIGISLKEDLIISEYSMDLGERRRIALAEHLIASGIEPTRLYLMSGGNLYADSIEDVKMAYSKSKIAFKFAKSSAVMNKGVEIIILGIAQDGGVPHIGCEKDCCKDRWDDPSKHIPVVCLGLIDHETGESWMFEATPDITTQIKDLSEISGNRLPNGIFITHAHTGHYTGLMYLGRESLGAKEMPVYTMPRMKEFLNNNGPWDQLIELKNIKTVDLTADSSFQLNTRIKITPFLIPHRDEYSETVGFKIEGPNKTALFVPDVDKWERWDKDLIEELKQVDIAFLDATFYSGDELPGRDISQIPHPFVTETIGKIYKADVALGHKIRFIHFNHTNPLLNEDSEEFKTVIKHGVGVAEMGERHEM